MIIYIDVILLENIIMNYIILVATAFISKTKRNHLKILLSSLLGSIYAVMSFLSTLEIYSTLILKILLSIAMIQIAFKPQKIKKMIKQIIIFYLTSFSFGGCAFFLLYYIRPQDILMKNGIYIGTYPLKITLLGGILGFIVINVCFRLVKERLNKNNMFCDITIDIEGKKANVKAMIDTGNLLKDPITKSPVIVVEKNSLNELIDRYILDNISKIIMGMEINLPEKYLTKMKVIPFTSLGKENGMLVGIRSDKITIHFEDEEKTIYGVIIGIYEKMLTKNNSYTALIGLDIIQGCEKNEFIANAKI